MGAKRVSTRILPSGEKVRHHPDGTQRLIPHNRVVATLVATRAATAEAAAGLDAKLLEAVEVKRALLDAGDPVPEDKRVI